MLTMLCQKALQGLDDQHLQRHLPAAHVGHSSFEFASNDYLQLSKHPDLLREGMATAKRYGAGATGSRLLSGNWPCFMALEEELAIFKASEAALFFCSGYQANATALACLLDKHLWQGQSPSVLCDRLNHASLHHACQLHGLKQHRFAPNSMQHLAELLHKLPTGPKVIVTESVFGMEGDAIHLAELADLALQHNAVVYLDEAHATGLLGPQGRGLGATPHPAIDALKAIGHWVVMGTCSKALGVSGAYIACSQALKQYLINRCRGFVYSTAPSPFVVGAVRAALRLVPTLETQRSALLQQAATLRQQVHALGFDTGLSNTHIVPLVVGCAKRSTALQAHLAQQGIRAFAVRPPTVPPQRACVRLALHVGHIVSSEAGAMAPGYATLLQALSSVTPFLNSQ